MRKTISLVLLLIAPVMLAAADDDVAKELKALEGTWKAVGMEAQGTALPKDTVIDFTFIIAAGGKSTGKSAQGEYQSTITVNPAKDPRTLNNLHETGQHKGRTQYGIYKLEGDTFTVCITAPGATEAQRPKDFATEDTANVVFIFERVKQQNP